MFWNSSISRFRAMSGPKAKKIARMLTSLLSKPWSPRSLYDFFSSSVLNTKTCAHWRSNIVSEHFNYIQTIFSTLWRLIALKIYEITQKRNNPTISSESAVREVHLTTRRYLVFPRQCHNCLKKDILENAYSWTSFNNDITHSRSSIVKPYGNEILSVCQVTTSMPTFQIRN